MADIAKLVGNSAIIANDGWNDNQLQCLPFTVRTTVRLTGIRTSDTGTVSSSSRRSSWPRRIACLQMLAGTDPVSVRSWSVARAWGRRGARTTYGIHFQSLPSERPDARPTWQCRTLCAGVPWASRGCRAGRYTRPLVTVMVKPHWVSHRWVGLPYLGLYGTARCYAERGYEIACRLSVRLSVCKV